MKKNLEEKSFAFRPGWMIVDCSSASGGIRYLRDLVKERQINKQLGLQTDHKTRKIVDNVEFCGHIDAVVKKVDYVLRKHCARTAMGWFADDAALKIVKEEIEDIQAEAAELNRLGRRAKSARHAKICVIPLRLDAAQPETVQEIASTIRGVLNDIHTALRDGDVASLHKLKLRAKNLDRLATGFHSDAIRFALDIVPAAANEIRRVAKVAEHGAKVNVKVTKSEVAKAVAAAAKKAGAQLDLTAIEAAMVHFEPSPLVDYNHDLDVIAQVG